MALIDDLVSEIQDLRLTNQQLIVERDQSQALLQRLQYKIDNHSDDHRQREELISSLMASRGTAIQFRRALRNKLENQLPKINSITKAQIIAFLKNVYDDLVNEDDET